MSRVPRLMDRPALDTTTTVDEGKGGFEHDGGEQEGRGSIDGETDDVSVMTDETSDEVAERQGNKKTKVGLLRSCSCHFTKSIDRLTHRRNNAHYPTFTEVEAQGQAFPAEYGQGHQEGYELPPDTCARASTRHSQ